jgi:polygalacturonase
MAYKCYVKVHNEFSHAVFSVKLNQSTVAGGIKMDHTGYSTVFNITEFGAISDKTTLCTAAVNAAIRAATTAGGGTIYVPAGQFLTGPIRFQSNLTLELDAGASLIFSPDPAEFPLVFTRWEGAECDVYAPLIYGSNLENVAVIGRGILDGCGEYWWREFRANHMKIPRPRFISFENCENVLIEGVKIINSPAWTINPIRCNNITIHKVNIKNPADSPNTDGINPDSCKNVHISDCHVDVGDDCITLKSGTEACRERIPCENITITNCTLVHGHGGVVIGSEMSGGIRNAVISNCVFEGTDRGIRIKSRRGRGGVVEDIRIDNVIMKGVITPFVMQEYYHCGPGGKEPHVWDKNPHAVDGTTPVFRRIHLSNITAREVGATAGFLYGLPEMPISDISFINVALHLARNAEPALPAMMDQLQPMKQQGLICNHVKNAFFCNVMVSGHAGPAFTFENANQIELSFCGALDADPGSPVFQLQDVTQATIRASRSDPELKNFLTIKGSQAAGIELSGSNVNAEQISFQDGADSSSLIQR